MPSRNRLARANFRKNMGHAELNAKYVPIRDDTRHDVSKAKAQCVGVQWDASLHLSTVDHDRAAVDMPLGQVFSP